MIMVSYGGKLVETIRAEKDLFFFNILEETNSVDGLKVLRISYNLISKSISVKSNIAGIKRL